MFITSSRIHGIVISHCLSTEDLTYPHLTLLVILTWKVWNTPFPC